MVGTGDIIDKILRYISKSLFQQTRFLFVGLSPPNRWIRGFQPPYPIVNTREVSRDPLRIGSENMEYRTERITFRVTSTELETIKKT